jgi:hypothetical protein
VRFDFEPARAAIITARMQVVVARLVPVIAII